MTAGKVLNFPRREGAFFVKAVNQRLRRSQKHLPRYSALGARATLALGGGGARGIAHLGAMEILRGLGVRIEHIAGVSIGSLAGALCALNERRKRFAAPCDDSGHVGRLPATAI